MEAETDNPKPVKQDVEGMDTQDNNIIMLEEEKKKSKRKYHV